MRADNITIEKAAGAFFDTSLAWGIAFKAGPAEYAKLDRTVAYAAATDLRKALSYLPCAPLPSPYGISREAYVRGAVEMIPPTVYLWRD